MTQKSKTQRERRRRKWYDEERPTLLVRWRLTGEFMDVLPHWLNTPFSRRDELRQQVSRMEKRAELIHSTQQKEL